MNRLTEVAILDSPNLTDEAFRYLSESHSLRKLKIACNANVSDTSVKMISRHCLELRFVSIIDCERITDISLKFLASCKQLQVLNMSDCIR
jgi:F-box and leucine-rich repeat protein 13